MDLTFYISVIQGARYKVLSHTLQKYASNFESKRLKTCNTYGKYETHGFWLKDLTAG